MEKEHTPGTESVTPSEEAEIADADESLSNEVHPDASTEDTNTETEETLEETEEVDPVARMAEEALLYKDRWMRLAAEFDNYKKRTSREFRMVVKNAGQSLISQLLPTLDNIERALQAPQTTEETKTFAQGVEMIRQQLQDTLDKEGLSEIEAAETAFDPTQHEAVMAVERDDHPADTVIEVVEKGYMLNEKVLRPAKVIVSRQPAGKDKG